MALSVVQIRKTFCNDCSRQSFLTDADVKAALSQDHLQNSSETEKRVFEKLCPLAIALLKIFLYYISDHQPLENQELCAKVFFTSSPLPIRDITNKSISKHVIFIDILCTEDFDLHFIKDRKATGVVICDLGVMA